MGSACCPPAAPHDRRDHLCAELFPFSWRCGAAIPKLPLELPRLQRAAARINEWLIYALLALQPTHGEVELLALLVGGRDALHAVAISQVTVGSDIEVGQFDGDRAVEVAEEALPILR